MRRRRQVEEEESIYDLIPQPQQRSVRAPMHRSKFPHDTPPTASTFGAASASQMGVSNFAGHYQEAPRVHRHAKLGGTLGPKSRHYSDPTTFLKKQSQPIMPTPSKFEYTSKRKPNVVTRKQAMKSPAQRNSTMRKTRVKRDFVTQNALAVIDAEPKAREAKGTNFLKKDDYGKSPAYLKRVNREIELETEYVRRVMGREQQEAINRQPQMRKLPEEERRQLLHDLKVKWAQVNKTYQTLTQAIDTIGKIRRKEQYESQLKQLETSIEKLSRPVVYVQDEAPMMY